MMKKRVPEVALLLMISLPSLMAGAQTVRERVEVNVVEVPVTVVDRSGTPVRNLEQGDFSVKVDGKTVPVGYFEMIDLGSRQVAREEGEILPSLHPAAQRKFLLLFDMTNSAPENLQRASEAGVAFVEKILLPEDLAAVATFSVDHGTRLVTNFTRDRAMLKHALETLGHEDYFRAADPLLISAGPEMAAAGKSLPRMGGEAIPQQILAEVAAEYNRENRKLGADQQKTRLRSQFENLSSLARILDSVSGQKQVILLSEGFDPTLILGKGIRGASSEAAVRGQIWELDSDEIYGSHGSSAELGQMGEVMKRSDVILHAIDIEGLRIGVGDFSSAKNESLFLMTEPTGGTVFRNTNHLEKTLADAAAHHEVVYVLGIEVPSGKEGDWHEIDVEVAERGVILTHRPGFYDRVEQPSRMEQLLAMGELMQADIQRAPVEVSTMAIPLPGAELARVPVIIEVVGEDLLRHAVGNALEADLLVYAFDDSGAVSGFFSQNLAFDLDKVHETLQTGGIRVYGEMNLRPGDYEIRTMLRQRAPGTPFGVARHSFTVSNEAPALPPIFFAAEDGWLMVRSDSAVNTGAYPFSLGAVSFVPAPAPVVGSEPQRFALYTWNVPLEQLGLQAMIESADGTRKAANVKLIGRTAPDEQNAAQLLFELDPSSLGAGEHELHVTLKPAGGTPIPVKTGFVVR